MSSFLHFELTGGSGGGTEPSARAIAARADAVVDAALVQRFNQGDENAFNEIVKRHRGRIFAVVAGCLRDRADVEEIVDDTLIRAYRGLGKFRGDSSLATWLYHIAINLARNRYWFLFRRRHLTSSLDAPVSSDGPASQGDFAPSEAPDPCEALEQRESSRVIVSYLERLPPRQRDALRLRGLLDNTYEDIASQLGVGVGTVKSRIARARRLLRKEVEDDGRRKASAAALAL